MEHFSHVPSEVQMSELGRERRADLCTASLALAWVCKKNNNNNKQQSLTNLNRSLNYCYHFGLRSAFFGNSLCCQAANSNGTVRRMLQLEVSSPHGSRCVDSTLQEEISAIFENRLFRQCESCPRSYIVIFFFLC